MALLAGPRGKIFLLSEFLTGQIIDFAKFLFWHDCCEGRRFESCPRYQLRRPESGWIPGVEVLVAAFQRFATLQNSAGNTGAVDTPPSTDNKDRTDATLRPEPPDSADSVSVSPEAVFTFAASRFDPERIGADRGDCPQCGHHSVEWASGRF